jgi:predicted enzyme related to lactoylglutathione lyase
MDKAKDFYEVVFNVKLELLGDLNDSKIQLN